MGELMHISGGYLPPNLPRVRVLYGKSDVSPGVSTFICGFAKKPSKVEVLDGLNEEAGGSLHKGISIYVSARPLNTGFMYKRPKIH